MFIADFMGSSSSGGGGGNGFYLYKQNGNTNFELVSAQGAGVYYITSYQEDVEYDVYAINASGELVGHTTSNRLIATDEFVKMVIVGMSDDDIFYFDTRDTTFTTSKTNIDDGGPAFITAVSISDLESYNDTTVITGGNFATDVEVYFVGTNAVDLPAKTIVRNSSAELIVSRPDNLLPDYAPYDVKIINPGIPLPTQAPTQHILENAITAGEYPIWVTTSPLFWERGTTTSITLLAEDNELSDIDYEIISGSLWPGFSMDQETGVITGDDSALNLGDSMTFTVRAVDTAGNYSSSDPDAAVLDIRSFVVYADQVPVSSLYFDPFVDAGQLEYVFLPDLNL